MMQAVTRCWESARSESIVGGTVTPDTFIVRRSDLTVVQRIVAGKQSVTVSAPGGTHEVEVPRFLRNISSLNDEQVTKLALPLEVTMGYPVDGEGATTRRIHRLAAALSEVEFSAAQKKGRAMTLEQALAFASET